MDKYNDEYFESKKFGPEAEENGGIKNTSYTATEADEAKKIHDLYSGASSPSKEKESKPRGGIRSFIVGRKLRSKSSVITLAMLLFGGGGFMTVTYTPSLALNALTTAFTQAYNDQFHAVSERTDMLLQAKLSDVTKGSCGLVKIACRFAGMSDTQAKRFKAAGIDVERKQGFILKNRGQITKMTFVGGDGKKIEITSAEQLHRMSLDNIEFRAAKIQAYNPLFRTLNPTDKIVNSVLKRMKARAIPVTGDTDEERQKRLNDAVGGANDGRGRPLIETEDKDKNKRYSVGGDEVSDEQADSAKGIASTIKDITSSGGYQSFAKGALTGLSILGPAQTACGAYTFGSVVSSLGQVEKGAQAVRFAMTGALSTESAQRAGEATEGGVNFIMNKATATVPSGKIIDESKLDQPGGNQSVQLIDNPSAGENAFDSDEYKWAAYQEVPASRDISETRFMLGGGTPTKLESGLNSIAKFVSPDNPTQKGVREKCRIITNPVVTGLALGVGVILGAGSFGVTTAIGVAGSVGFSLLAPYFMSQIADIVAGDVFTGPMNGKEFGSATGVGTSFFLSSIARARGAKPLNKEEGVKYMQKNIAANVTYDETQRYIARSNPFDVNNRYSFLGSLAYSAAPYIQKSKSNASVAMMNMASLVPTALTSLTPKAKAAVPADFLSCNDPNILGAGINADFNCVVHYGATDRELQIKPVENALWMNSTGNINPDSEAGDPKDNGQSWNYVKFLSECVNRTTGWGIPNDQDLEDGSNCTDPAKEPLNEQFRTYTMNRTINESMDTEPQAMSTDETEAYTDGQTGTVTAGWSFPTKDDAVVSEAFGAGSGREKNGMTLTANNPADTEGMPLFAVHDGKVVAAGTDAEIGNRIILNHWINGQLVSTVYGHLGKNSIASGLKPGDEVKAGQQIGVITKEDNQPNARLYFEMWEGPTTTGQPVDPMGTLGVTRKAKEVTHV